MPAVVYDKAIGVVRVTPQVILADDADGDGTYVIHHDIKGSVGGDCCYPFGIDDKWYYNSSKISTTTTAKLIDTSTEKFTDNSALIVDADEIRFLFVRHTGKDVNGDDAASNIVWVDLSGNVSDIRNAKSAIVLRPSSMASSVALQTNISGNPPTVADFKLICQFSTNAPVLEVLAVIHDV